MQSLIVDMEAPDGTKRSVTLEAALKGAFKGISLLDPLRRIEAEGCLRQAHPGMGPSPTSPGAFVDMTAGAPGSRSSWAGPENPYPFR